MFTHFAPGVASNDEDMVKEVVAIMNKQIFKNVTNFQKVQNMSGLEMCLMDKNGQIH
jgi:hypothetical protein